MVGGVEEFVGNEWVETKGLFGVPVWGIGEASEEWVALGLGGRGDERLWGLLDHLVIILINSYNC